MPCTVTEQAFTKSSVTIHVHVLLRTFILYCRQHLLQQLLSYSTYMSLYTCLRHYVNLCQILVTLTTNAMFNIVILMFENSYTRKFY